MVLCYTANKHDIIPKVYGDLNKYGPRYETTRYAKAIDKSSAFSDVKECFDDNGTSKNQVEGANSFIANSPYQDYQLDVQVIKR